MQKYCAKYPNLGVVYDSVPIHSVILVISHSSEKLEVDQFRGNTGSHVVDESCNDFSKWL